MNEAPLNHYNKHYGQYELKQFDLPITDLTFYGLQMIFNFSS